MRQLTNQDVFAREGLRAAKSLPIAYRWISGLLFLATAHIAWADSGHCKWEGGPGTAPECKAEDCAEDGGSATCTLPILIPSDGNPAHADAQGFDYDMCDEGAPLVGYEADWCVAAGGTWNGPTSCTNLPPVVIGGGGTGVKDESVLIPFSTNFVRLATNPCSGPSVGSDSGWGKGSSTDPNCWNFYPQSKNGLVIHDRREVYFDGDTISGGQCSVPFSALIVMRRDRNIKCPIDTITRTKSNGDLQCVICPTCLRVGHPVSLVDGSEIKEEKDYESGGIGGLSFSRFYNSAGYFRETVSSASAMLPSDYWRNTYSQMLFPVVGNAYVMASAQRPDGSVIYFDTTGHQIQNVDGASATLVAVSGGSAAWKITLGDDSVELYDATGRLLSTTTRAGLTTTLSYNAANRLQSITDQFGRALTLTYDANGNLSTLVDPANNAITYGYDSLGRLTSVTYPGNRQRQYLYQDPDTYFLLTGITDENGQSYETFTYDSSGRVIDEFRGATVDEYSFSYSPNSTLVQDPLRTSRTYGFAFAGGAYKLSSLQQPCVNCGSVTTSTKSLTYDTNGNIATRIDFNGNQTIYVYDLSRNLETSRTEGLGPGGVTTAATRTITTQWNATYRLPVQITEPSDVSGTNRVTTFGYDANGNLLTKTIQAASLTRTWTYTYDTYGRVLTVDGPRTDVADTTTYTYYSTTDSCVACRGQINTITDAVGNVTTFTLYDANARPLQITGANGALTVYSYDARGWILSRTLASGTAAAETTQFTYDATGNLKTITLPDNSVQTLTYDAAHRLIAVADSAGDAIHYALDGAGNRVGEQITDAQGNLRKLHSRVFDALSHLTRDLDAYGAVAALYYDKNGNQQSVLDPLDRRTAHSFDALNRMVKLFDPAGGATSYTYNAQDNLTLVTDATGLQTSFAYDGLGDPTSITSPDTGLTTFAFDAAGNKVGQTDGRGISTTYQYDALNRILQSAAGTGVSAVTTSYSYDTGANGKGLLTSISGGGSAINYIYDNLGRVISTTETVGSLSRAITYSYQSGHLASITYPSGMVVSYGYDINGKISTLAVNGQIQLTAGKSYPFGEIEQFTLLGTQPVVRQHDLDGRIVQVTLGPGGITPPPGNFSYAYDSQSRVIGATLPNSITLTYGYDLVGDRISEATNGVNTTLAYATNSHQVSSMLGGQNISYSYDGSGNQTQRGSISPGYDARGRMTSVAGGTTAQYVINGVGQRVQKTVGGQIQRFVFDFDGKLIGEYDVSGNTSAETIYINDIPVILNQPSTPGGSVNLFAIYSDSVGSPRQIADSTGILRWQWFGEPFGATASNENPAGAGAFTYNLRFPGQYYDAETGLNYNYFRDYDAATGRYIESDPIGLDGGLNTYAYANGNGLRYSDPTGEQAEAALSLGGESWVACPICLAIAGGVIGGSWLGTKIYENNADEIQAAIDSAVAMASPGNVADTQIVNDYYGEASRQRLKNCPPPDRCKWLEENASKYRPDQVKATEKAWGCRGSRLGKGGKSK